VLALWRIFHWPETLLILNVLELLYMFRLTIEIDLRGCLPVISKVLEGVIIAIILSLLGL